MTITYEWRGNFEKSEVNALHAEAFDHPVFVDDDWDWKTQVQQHSLGGSALETVGTSLGSST